MYELTRCDLVNVQVDHKPSVACPLHVQVVLRSNLASRTYMSLHREFFPPLLIQEKQDVSNWSKNYGH